jgi:hypothetical protein
MEARPERRHRVDSGAGREFARERGKTFAVRCVHGERGQVRVFDHLAHGAAREHAPEGDIRDLVAALRFVHVMGGDENGEAAGREVVNLAPEIAPRLGVDARGRLVEQEQLRIGQRAGAERGPLLPAARQLARDLLLAAFEPEPGDHRLGGARRARQAVDARDEFQILAHRKILVETEVLRHVADARLDLCGFGADVEAEAGAAALVGREQAAQHADGGGLARAVGAEEAEDRAAPDLHRQVADDHSPAERFGQAAHVDDDVARRLGRDRGRRAHRDACGVGAGAAVFRGNSVTSTGCPTRSSPGFSGSASIRKTSLERSSRL